MRHTQQSIQSRLDRSIAEASPAVDRVGGEYKVPASAWRGRDLQAGIEPEWSREDRRLAGEQLERAVAQFRRYAGRDGGHD